jgi:hypothetical protein
MGWLKGKSLLPMWLVLTGASIVDVDQASACSCVAPSADSAASVIERADVAFEGEVVDVDLKTPCVSSEFRLRDRAGQLLSGCEPGWQLRVLTPLKGNPGDIVTVHTPRNDATCGYKFRRGERLKVVAWYTRERRLSTNLCAMLHANH